MNTDSMQVVATERPFWSSKHLQTDSDGRLQPWVKALAISVVALGARFVFMSGTCGYEYVYLSYCMLLAWMPFMLLDAGGRRKIGLHLEGLSLHKLGLMFSAGATCGMLFFCLGEMVYGDTSDSWNTGVRDFLCVHLEVGILPPIVVAFMYAVPAVLILPFGEECMLRGLTLEAFADRWNKPFAWFVTSVIFAVSYLSLHGVYSDSGGLHLRWQMVILGQPFIMGYGMLLICSRWFVGSLMGSIAMNAGFRLAYLLLIVFHYMY